MVYYALVAAVLVSILKTNYGYTSNKDPIFMGFVFGLLFGDMMQCLLLACGVQSLYMGVIAPGGNTPADQVLAAGVAVPVAFTSGIGLDAAIVLAVPIGLIGAQLTNIRYILNGFLVEPCDKAFENLQFGKYTFLTMVFPFFITLALYGTVVFGAVYFGSSAVEAVFEVIPQWVLNGLSCAGGILPATGFAVTIMVIGQKKLIPFFIIGYFVVKFFGLGTLPVGIFAVCMALLISFGFDREEA